MGDQTAKGARLRRRATDKTLFTKGIGPTLLAWFLSISLLPLIIAGAVTIYIAREELKNDAYQSLVAATELEATYVNSYFKRVLNDLDYHAKASSTARLLESLQQSYQRSGKSLADYVGSYGWELIVHDRAADTITFKHTYNYYDVLLVDVEGNILFSVIREKDLGKNIFGDKELVFADAFKQVMENGRPRFSDFYRYKLSNNIMAGFFLSLVLNDDGDKIGCVVVRLSTTEIDSIMQQAEGFGKTGESYLIGTDLKMRSNSRFATTSLDLTEPVNTVQTRLWRDAHHSLDKPFSHKRERTLRYMGYRGKEMFGAHDTVEAAGVRLGVITEIEVDEALAPVSALMRAVVPLLALTVAIVIFIAIVTVRRIVQPVLELSAAAERISGGDLEEDIKVSARNEIGELAETFNLMVQNLRKSRDRAVAQDHLKTGESELNKAMHGVQDVTILGNNIISCLADFLGAQIGALYMVEKPDSLRMIGSYAYKRLKNDSSKFKVGDGLVGQAALEKKPIVLSQCPADYITIHSGLGEAVPTTILVYPLIKDENVLGVIELGSFEVFGDEQIGFLDEIGRSIAVTLNAAKDQARTRQLLAETQRQSEQLTAQQEAMTAANEQLRTQQEELQSTNEELEEQTQRLRVSEESLQSQQEELRVSNEEPEEKNRLLERQSLEVDKARRNSEVKAEELAVASKYKSQFLANMSHELRSPLNSLLLLADSLKRNRDGNLNTEEVESAMIIHESGTDLLNLINEILDLSKIEAGRMDLNYEQVEVADIADAMRKSFSHLAEEKGLAFDVTVEKELPNHIFTDRQRLEQILRNLLSNALKFTEQGTVSMIFGRTGDHIDLKTEGLTEKNSFSIAVADTGIGLAADKQKLIFKAFQQAEGGTARPYSGTGLGLAISKELSLLLGGEINLQSELGTGSTFTLILPLELSANKTARRSKSGSAKEQVEGSLLETHKTPGTHFDDDRNNLRKGESVVLVIEDDLPFADVLYKHAHEHHFHCLVASSGEEGVKLAEKYEPTAITLDLKLPGMDGWQVLARLKENSSTRHIPVHIISASEQDADSIRRGAIGHLTKPVNRQELEKVFKAIEKRSSKRLKRLLVVEDSKAYSQVIVNLMKEMDISIDTVESGKSALDMIGKGNYDCVVLDLKLKDMDGDELLQKLGRDQSTAIPPVIVYTSLELSREKEMELREYASSIILKDSRSHGRLLDEVTLFLHSVRNETPDDKRLIAGGLYDTDEMLVNRKMLVVDDDMRTMFALSKLLSSKGLHVLKAENGHKALELLEKEADIGLVLTDIMMPDMDGYELIRRIRAQQQFKELPVIALTAKAMKEDRENSLAVGASDYLPKPVDRERLLSMLRVWLSK